jgi:hypothetical protein
VEPEIHFSVPINNEIELLNEVPADSVHTEIHFSAPVPDEHSEA